MNAVDIVGWVGTVGVLASYAIKRGRYFDRANAALWLPVAAPAFVRGAYSTAAISAAFGVIGTVKVLRRSR